MHITNPLISTAYCLSHLLVHLNQICRPSIKLILNLKRPRYGRNIIPLYLHICNHAITCYHVAISSCVRHFFMGPCHLGAHNLFVYNISILITITKTRLAHAQLPQSVRVLHILIFLCLTSFDDLTLYKTDLHTQYFCWRFTWFKTSKSKYFVNSSY
jgi:hypothetical protein